MKNIKIKNVSVIRETNKDIVLVECEEEVIIGLGHVLRFDVAKGQGEQYVNDFFDIKDKNNAKNKSQ